jgi:hypothetical protein
VNADGVADHARLALAVVHDGVDVGDLAEAVAAQFERRGHESEAPLADVERGARLMVVRRVPVGNDHLGKRQPVRHRSHAIAVPVAERVDHERLARVEAEPHRPALPTQEVAFERERDTARL